MMRNKFLILTFGLLLAVGWTNDASAQKLDLGKPWYQSAFFQKMKQPKMMENPKAKAIELSANEQAEGIDGQPSRAPMRANYTQTANVTHIKSWYDGKSYTWYDAEGNSQGTASFTDAVTDSCQMFWFIRNLYTNPEMPGIKYTEAQDYDLAYNGCDFGYWISGDVTQDIEIQMSSNCYITYIAVFKYDDFENPITSYDVNSSLPSGWSMPNQSSMTRSSEYVSTSSGSELWYYWKLTSNSSTTYTTAFKISSSLLSGKGGVYVYVIARSASSSTAENRDYSYRVRYYDYNRNTYYTFGGEQHLLTNSWDDYLSMVNGPITPPTENGYSVVLVKLKDDVTNVPKVDTYTLTDSALYSYYNKYVKELQLLTDGLRVNEGTSDAGTLFAYSGDVNKFFYISKGKLYPISGSENAWHYDDDDVYERYSDRAPFYNMYEEFSPYVDSGTEDHSDLYSELKKGVTYPILHDCQSVLHMTHWFTIASDDGSTENRVNSLVLYIPDQRGLSGSRSYETAHQPTVGMYMIDLFAEIEPSTTPDYYTTTVTWEDNLDVITHRDGIPQTYYLYEIRDKNGDGVMDTTLVYTGPNTSWNGEYPVGDPTAYDIYYYVIGVPTAATNPDTFFAKSNTDDVTVPGKTDFVGLQWVRYESDFVTRNEYDPTKHEVNYYRNWLAPHALSTSNQAGISAGNVGTTGRILTLYRETEPIIDLEVVMNGNKAYYRIKYRDRQNNQQVEHGYNENTGELNSNK